MGHPHRHHHDPEHGRADNGHGFEAVPSRLRTTHRHQHHPHGLTAEAGDRRVLWAILVNVVLTLAQIVGGVLAGSLALVADAIHNLSDAAALGLAFGARRIARRPSNETMTFGYGRAELIAALINYTTLVVISVYLVSEAVWRLAQPEPVDGWIVVVIAGIALVIDSITAVLTFRLAKGSANIRAAFLHNIADALGSVGVIIAGTLVILFDWWIVDATVTIAIAAYILWHVFREIGGVIRVLMLGVPPDIDATDVVQALSRLTGIVSVHHLHLWQIDEHSSALQAHLVLTADAMTRPEEIKSAARKMLSAEFGIGHTTLELECDGEGCVDPTTIGHRDSLMIGH